MLSIVDFDLSIDMKICFGYVSPNINKIRDAVRNFLVNSSSTVRQHLQSVTLPRKRLPICKRLWKSSLFSELQACVKQRHDGSNPDVWFLGDSRIRQHYSSFLGLFLKHTPNLKNATADGEWFTTKFNKISAVYVGHNFSAKIAVD